MLSPRTRSTFIAGIGVCLMLTTAACSRVAPPSGVKTMKAGQEYAGFLKDYSKLAPNPAVDGDVKTYAQTDAQKNLRSYIAVIVDPVEIYLASDADGSKLPEKTRAAAANYFRAALTQAVFDAFPVVDQPGPLVLRLRAALIGVDAGASTTSPQGEAEHAANISKVGVEMELVDSATGEQIAAMVDREPLGEGQIVETGGTVRHDRSAEARAAFDEWAGRVRTFLNRAHELSSEDATRAAASYKPYGPAPGK
jgi:Protein of unknown function (DUF3313)